MRYIESTIDTSKKEKPPKDRTAICSVLQAFSVTGDAKLWITRTRANDDLNAGRSKIDSWESFEELTDQFLPYNVSWVAMGALKSLKHTCTVREYVKQYTSPMLDITDMSEAQLELRRQGVKDLLLAIVATDSLVYLRIGGARKQTGKDVVQEKWTQHGRENGERAASFAMVLIGRRT